MHPQGEQGLHLGPGRALLMQLMGRCGRPAQGRVAVIDISHALPPGPEGGLARLGVHVYMVVPMIAWGELIGAISFGGAPGPFPDEQVASPGRWPISWRWRSSKPVHAQVQRQRRALEARVAERQRAERRYLQQLAASALLHQITRAIGERQDCTASFLGLLQHLEQELPLAFACLGLGPRQ